MVTWSTVRTWLTTTNHKRVGLLYLGTAVFFLLVAGVTAMHMRLQLAVPDGNILSPFLYEEAATYHGLTMILWVLSPLGVAFANYFVPLQIGTKDLAFPRLNALSYWLYLFSGFVLLGTQVLPGGGPTTGWTMYAPLAGLQYSPQVGMTLGALAVGVLAASVTISSVNFLTTIIGTRVKGMSWSKLPVFSWSVLFTNALMLFAFPPLLIGIILLTSDRLIGTSFFTAIQGGSILWDQLFWFFGHPEVYIVVLPALGVMAEVISTFSRRPLFAKKIFVFELAFVTLLSFGVWMHHMFMTGINFDVLQAFSFTTMAISIPFEGVVINMILTMHKGSLRLKTPMLFAIGAVFFVILGGITGVFQASMALDEVFRGSYWVVGHFHYVMVGTTLFGLLAAAYYWWPKITNRSYSEKLGRISFVVSFIGFNVLYFPYFFLIDMPRRVGVYADLPQLWPFNLTATIGAFIFGPAIAFILLIFVKSYRDKQKTEKNVWDSHSPEWLEVYDDQSSEPEQIRTENPSPNAEKREYPESSSTPVPIIAAAGASLAVIGLSLFFPLFILGLLVILVSAVLWSMDNLHDRFADVVDTVREKWPFQSLSKEKLGVWVFMASEVVVFGTLIAAYLYIRARSDPWPIATQVHNLYIGTANTLILLTSSLLMILALQAVRRGSNTGLKAGLVGTFSLGGLFLVLKLGIEWPQEIAKGFVISGGLPQSTYYAIMGTHAIHVGIGLAGLSYLLVKAFKGRFNVQSHTSVELFGIYWSFVDIVWIFLFPLFYLI